MANLTIGAPVHFVSDEVGIVNGTYRGFWFADLHKFDDLTGKACAGALALAGRVDGIHAGHHPRGKRKWSANRYA